MKKLNMKDLENKKLLSDEVGTMASIISKDKKIRKLVHLFQIDSACGQECSSRTIPSPTSESPRKAFPCHRLNADRCRERDQERT